MANLFVSNLNDSGGGSLRAALAFAQTNSGTEFDVFFSGFPAGGEIELLSALTINSGTARIHGDVDGDGNPDIVISGDSNKNNFADLGDTRLFTIGAGASVTLDTLRLTNAFEQAANGEPGADAAAVAKNAGTLNISDCLIDNSFAGGGNGTGASFGPVDGGDAAIILNTGALDIRDTLFDNANAFGGNGRDGILGFDVSGGGGDGGDAAIVLTQGPGSAALQGTAFRTANVFGGNGGDGFDSPGAFDGGNGGNGGNAAAMIFDDASGVFFTRSDGLATLSGVGGQGGTSTGGGPGLDGTNGLADDDILRLGTPSGFGGPLVNQQGTAGDDTLFVGAATASPGNADIVNGFFGDDTILGLDFSKDVLAGNGGNDFLFGRGGDDVLIGGDGNDTLKGDAGNDIMNGGFGDDVFYVGSTFDLISEGAGEGADRVIATVSYTLTAGTEVELMTTSNSGGGAPIDLTGNELAQQIIGNAGVNTLKDGGGAADTLTGLGGNDTYRIFGTGTKIVETAGQGTLDRVISAVDYTLGAGVQVEQMTTNGSGGTTGIDLTGNEFTQEIIGNAGINTLRDGAGAADALKGLGGNDTYRIYTSATTIVESSTNGTADRVAAAVDYVLGADVGIEIMTTNGQTGTSGIDLTGNALKQEITGNAGVNILSDGGGAGQDTLRGLGGNDTYIVRNGATNIQEGASEGANDVVAAGVTYVLDAGVRVESLRTTSSGSTAAINLAGNEFAQEVTGNAGANRLHGGGGLDTLNGGGGADTFVFNTALGAGNVDTISDFNVAADTIELENAIFVGLAAGTLTAGAFRANTTGLAQDADDRIIYETDTGNLFFDANGTGAGGGILFAELVVGFALTNGDFAVI